MSRRAAAPALVLVVALTGCGAEERDVPSQVQSLWSSRVRYLDDSSRVAALVREVGPAPEDSYSIALRTTKPPQALTIELERLHKPFGATDFREPATLLLGLVTDLDTVSVTSSGHAYTLTATAASSDLGYDVKELGRERSRLTAYLDANSD